MLLQLSTLHLLEVVVIEDFHHFGAHAGPLLHHAFGEDLLRVLSLAFVEGERGHNVAAVSLLVVEYVLVGGVHGRNPEDHLDEQIEHMVDHHESQEAEHHAQVHAKNHS